MALQQVAPGCHLEVTSQQKGHEPCDLVANSWPITYGGYGTGSRITSSPRPESGKQDRHQ